MKLSIMTIVGLVTFHVESSPSIAGVTYMDDFDFEARYRDVYECDPFYYHPLHLPEKCANMYEQLIRSKIARNAPVPVFKARSNEKEKSEEQTSASKEPCSDEAKESKEENPDINNHIYQINYQIPEPEQQNVYVYQKQYPQPYAGLMTVLDREAAKSPAAPTFASLPYIGPVALYRQPIGKESRKLIEKWSRRYTHTDDETQKESFQYYGKITKDMNLNGTNPIAEILNATKHMTPENVKLRKF